MQRPNRTTLTLMTTRGAPMTKKILVIDDEPEIANLLVLELTSYGYEVDTANDGMTGCEKARKLLPDIILLDVMMPGWSGIDTANKLNAYPETYDIPIVFITAMGEDSAAGQYLGKSRFSYLFKPFLINELLPILKNVYGI
jgi:DNA-binding response OmpR family regulator